MRSTTLTFAVIGALAALPGLAAAQRLSLRPQIGIYVPTKDLVALSQSGDVSKLQAGPSFGAALGLRFGSHLGIEVTGTYVPTTFSQGIGGSFAKQDAKLFLGNAQVVFHVLPPSSIAVALRQWRSRGGEPGRHRVHLSSQDLQYVGRCRGGRGNPHRRYQPGGRRGPLPLHASYTGTQQTTSEVKQLDVQLRLGLGFGMGGR
jgi:hypothetical protein